MATISSTPTTITTFEDNNAAIPPFFFCFVFCLANIAAGGADFAAPLALLRSFGAETVFCSVCFVGCCGLFGKSLFVSLLSGEMDPWHRKIDVMKAVEEFVWRLCPSRPVPSRLRQELRLILR